MAWTLPSAAHQRVAPGAPARSLAPRGGEANTARGLMSSWLENPVPLPGSQLTLLVKMKSSSEVYAGILSTFAREVTIDWLRFTGENDVFLQNV